MRRAVEHRRIVPEDVLRAVAVMHVPVDDRRRARRHAVFCAWRAAIAAVLNRQKPIAVASFRHGGRAAARRRRRCRRGPRIDVVDRGVGGADRRQRRLPALRADRWCRRRCGRCPSRESPARTRSTIVGGMRGEDWSPRRLRGALTRSSAAKASSSSTRSMARSRSGRSGWPGGVMCSRKIGWE